MSKPDSLIAYLQALEVDSEYLREALRLMLELLMELEISVAIDASPYERKMGRKSYRNGYRERKWQTDLGEISLRIPKLRKGTYYPSFIESLPDTEPLLLALVQDAYVQGVSVRNIEHLLRRLGLPAAHKSQIADIAERLDDMVYRFRQRPLKSAYPYLVLDTLRLDTHGAEPLSVAIAIGIRRSGQKEILGFEVVEQENFWNHFLRGLKRRGLEDIEIVVGDDDNALKRAVRDIFGDVAWESRREQAEIYPPLVSAISTHLLDVVVGQSRVPKASLMELFDEALLTAYTLIKVQHALSRPADAVGMSFDEAARLVGIVLVMIDALWQGQAPTYELRQPLAA
jgi:transposase-like protein